MSENETTTINTVNDVTVNGKTYKAGERIVVPKNQAEDILRMDHDHNKYLAGLHVKHTYNVNSGTIAAGGE